MSFSGGGEISVVTSIEDQVTANNSIAQLIAALGQHVTTINTYFTQTIPAAMSTAAQAITTAMNASSTPVLTFRY